jgi:hypothetical protein
MFKHEGHEGLYKGLKGLMKDFFNTPLQITKTDIILTHSCRWADTSAILTG